MCGERGLALPLCVTVEIVEALMEACAMSMRCVLFCCYLFERVWALWLSWGGTTTRESVESVARDILILSLAYDYLLW